MSGKGSGRRPTNEEQYKNNWDTIFGKKKVEQEQKDRDELPKQTKDTDQ